ncbi:hypothetical protein [Rhizobacter sp. Root1221]|uniref:hypothetical protein n=1 Tax=Rhizobacter sp. Root1221 TaxID=1736433 RepID=UPI000B0E1606|nr:hypothetical protein [Rhizobacter sp. Root1221]
MTSARLTLAACAFTSMLLITGCKTNPASPDSQAPAQSGAAAPAPAPAPATKEDKKKPQGEVVGTPAPGSKFNKVQFGMGMKQVTDLVGQPTDQGAYVTGKAFIPFHFGGDTYRHELLYKGVGRLVFAGGSFGNYGNSKLIRIIHNADESGYR